ncbi:MAG: HAMP domain-containing protein [Deferribacteres bacterium]|nr:HAMP domain-containing protein [candidate division KSB1 bacterium]MCB9502715.1 HAMP domain-containing protein [Deferribacteres bacterium]
MLQLGMNKKVLIFSLVCILIFASMIGFTLQRSANASVQEEFTSRGEVLTRNLAFNTKVGLVFQDTDNLNELANGVITESGVELVLVLDANNTILVKHGDENTYDLNRLSNIKKDQKHPLIDYSKKRRINFAQPVINDGEIVGSVVIGLSTEKLLQKIKEANFNAILITIFMSMLSIAFITLVANKKLKQLHQIKEFAEELASGQHGKTISVISKDEIGDLANSLNIMSGKIGEALEEAETNYRKSQESAQSLAQAHERAVKEKSALADAANRMQKTFERIKDGDLSRGAVLKGKSELTEVGDGLNAMLKEFSSILTQIRSMTHSLEKTSQIINEVSHQITSGAERQQTQTVSITSSVREMAHSLELSQAGIKNARTVAVKAQQKANDGGVVVNRAIDGINRIAQIVDDSTSTVRSLGEQSQQINDIVQVIEEIADQTNLLALNAAIEAARAGEQGRGFAVVADEVRKLAERTSRATGEIASLIKKVSQLTDDAVQAMNTGNAEMKSGRDLVQNIGSVLHEIVGSIESIQHEFEDLVGKSQEQHYAGEQISEQIDLIQDVAQQNTIYVQEVQETGNDLQQQISTLILLVSRFKTEKIEKDDLSPTFVEIDAIPEEENFGF